MRISDWSSDVCSSDLGRLVRREAEQGQNRAALLVELGFGGTRLDTFGNRLIATGLTLDPQVPQGRAGDGMGDHEPQCHAGMIGQHGARGGMAMQVDIGRSEEHTSELQSLMRISYAVLCLKKKKLEETNSTH